MKGFNPCFIGTSSVAAKGAKEDLSSNMFQSLFYWNFFCSVKRYIEGINDT